MHLKCKIYFFEEQKETTIAIAIGRTITEPEPLNQFIKNNTIKEAKRSRAATFTIANWKSNNFLKSYKEKSNNTIKVI